MCLRVHSLQGPAGKAPCVPFRFLFPEQLSASAELIECQFLFQRWPDLVRRPRARVQPVAEFVSPTQARVQLRYAPYVASSSV